MLVEQHVVRFDVAVDEAHGVDGVQRQHHLGCVEAGPLLGDVVVHGEGDHVAAGHELHHHVEVAVILERAAQLENSHRTSVNAPNENGRFKSFVTIISSLKFQVRFNKIHVSVHLHHPGTVGESHDVPLLPKEGRVGPLDHLKFVELFHGVDLLRGLMANLSRNREGARQYQQLCQNNEAGTV